MTARISLIQGERAVIDRPYSLRFSLRIPNYETPHQSPGPGRHISRDVATDLSRRGSLIVRRGGKALINQASWPPGFGFTHALQESEERDREIPRGPNPIKGESKW